MRAAMVLPVVVTATAALALAGCGGDDDGAPPRPAPPVAAQLSPQRVTPRPTLRRIRVASGFARPTDLVRAPGARGRTLVLEQGGTARWLDGDRPAAGPPFLDLRGTIRVSEEQGLLGLAFYRERDGTRGVVVHSTDPEGESQVVAYRLRAGRVDPLTARRILRVEHPYANHNGGEIVTGPDGRVYLGMGDGGSAYDPRQKAQDLGSQLGKLLRWDPAARRPRWRIVALGLRNPWRLSFDARTGSLWVADAGRDSAEQQTEEVDRVPAAHLRGSGPPVNFGWSAYEGARVQSNRRLTPRTTLSWPIASYTQRDGCSVTGGVALRGDAAPAAGVLRERYVFGDYCSGRIWSVPADARAGGEVRREGLRLTNQTSYLVDRDGRLLVSTHGGSVWELRDARPAPR
jgi:glucose/arabinose dehydrogenase